MSKGERGNNKLAWTHLHTCIHHTHLNPAYASGQGCNRHKHHGDEEALFLRWPVPPVENVSLTLIKLWLCFDEIVDHIIMYCIALQMSEMCWCTLPEELSNTVRCQILYHQHCQQGTDNCLPDLTVLLWKRLAWEVGTKFQFTCTSTTC